MGDFDNDSIFSGELGKSDKDTKPKSGRSGTRPSETAKGMDDLMDKHGGKRSGRTPLKPW